MSGAVPFRNLSTSDFLRRFGHQAQTSQFRAVLQVGTLPFTKNYNPQGGRFYDDLSFLCNSTSLPGSSFSTTENLQDYYGVNQKYAYRRDFDDLSLDFYVDARYQTLKFFEQWMDYISSPATYSVVTDSDPSSEIAFYRFKYPREQGGYKCRIDLHKFDRDYDKTKNDILYSFVNAFPRSLSSMPVSYDGSSLLKCSVTFAFDRYYVNRNGGIQEANDTVDTTTPVNNPSANGPLTEATKGLDVYKKANDKLKVGDKATDPEILGFIEEERQIAREREQAKALQRGESIDMEGGGKFSFDIN
jgi:hypothetical protein